MSSNLYQQLINQRTSMSHSFIKYIKDTTRKDTTYINNYKGYLSTQDKIINSAYNDAKVMEFVDQVEKLDTMYKRAIKANEKNDYTYLSLITNEIRNKIEELKEVAKTLPAINQVSKKI